MRFALLAALAAYPALALRPEIARMATSNRVAMVHNAFSKISTPKDTSAALQAAAGIVNEILAETGNATEHMSDDDAALLREVVDLVENSIYGSMDSAHEADEASLAAGLHAVEHCNSEIARRQSPAGDLGKLQQDTRGDQVELNRLQGVVDDKTSENASAWDTFDNHMQMISNPPACPAITSRTMPVLDGYFEKSEYVLWFTHQSEAYADARALYSAADAALTDAINAFNIQKAIRDTQYCDWKAELEAACDDFDECFVDNSDDFTKNLVPRVQGDMNARIENYRAGQTLIHQIRFLLAEVSDQATPAIATSRFELDFPTLPEKGQCDLGVLGSSDWVPVPQCGAAGPGKASPQQCNRFEAEAGVTTTSISRPITFAELKEDFHMTVIVELTQLPNQHYSGIFGGDCHTMGLWWSKDGHIFNERQCGPHPGESDIAVQGVVGSKYKIQIERKGSMGTMTVHEQGKGGTAWNEVGESSYMIDYAYTNGIQVLGMAHRGSELFTGKVFCFDFRND